MPLCSSYPTTRTNHTVDLTEQNRTEQQRCIDASIQVELFLKTRAHIIYYNLYAENRCLKQYE